MVKFLYYLWDKKNADGIKTKVLTEHEEGKTMKQMRQMSVINEFAAGEDYVDWIKGRASGDFELFDDEYKGNVTFTDGEVVAIHSKKGLNDAAM